MALITLRQLLDHAAEHGYGVPAFNINNMEQGLAILKAAAETDAPVILQASRGARAYAGDIMLRHMVQALAEMNPTVPICLHQDHGNNLATCMSAIRHLSPLDRLLDSVQNALSTVLGAPRAERPNPGLGEPDVVLDEGLARRLVED